MLRSLTAAGARAGKTYAWERPEFLASAARAQAYARLHNKEEPSVVGRLSRHADTLALLECSEMLSTEEGLLRSDLLRSVGESLNILGERVVAKDFLEAAIVRRSAPTAEQMSPLPVPGPSLVLSEAPERASQPTMTFLSSSRFFAL